MLLLAQCLLIRQVVIHLSYLLEFLQLLLLPKAPEALERAVDIPIQAGLVMGTSKAAAVEAVEV
jgi:hypothetical protein